MTFSNILTSEVTDILSQLETNGFSAFLVGGCVRDAILKRECNDIDIATNATTAQMLEIFDSYETQTAGIGFGTVNVRGKSGNIFDITSFRQEGEYIDGRHPSSVTFSGDIHTDLSRRDFTVNSMAVNRHAELVDDYGGLHDCTARQIKTVRTATVRFSEDYLRILRALRFSAVLDFSVEQQTAGAINELSHLCAKIPPERAFEELRKLFSTPYNLRLSDILATFPDIFNILFGITDVKKTAERIRKLGSKTNFILKLAMIFFEANPQNCNLLNHKNFLSKSDEKLFYSLLRTDSQKLQNRADVIKQINLLGKENVELLTILKDDSPNEKELIRQVQTDITTGLFPFSANELAVKGTDLINIGLHGKTIGNALEKLLFCVQNKMLANEKKAMLDYIESTFLKDKK